VKSIGLEMLLACIILSGALVASAQMPHRTPEDVAENARWVVHSASWGYVTELDGATGMPVAGAASFSDGEAENSTGRLFFYVMGSTSKQNDDAGRLASLTISEAGLNTTCGDRDPEDPRCAKITLSGTMKKSSGIDIALGKTVLFARHPQMQTWPKGHNFEVNELVLSNIWMIDFYGGGGDVKVSDFLAAKAKHNVPSWPPRNGEHHDWHHSRDRHHGEHGSWHHHGKHSQHQHEARDHTSASLFVAEPPPWNQIAARARWLVYHSIWGSVGTTSVDLKGAPWGGMRSTADGFGKNSTGIPVLYIPTPDPLASNLRKDNHATLSFSEAALTERLSSNGTCDGKDTEDPTCAQITLSGQLRALSTSEIKQAEINLGQRHPLAPWLAAGGDHTGGKYYAMDIDHIMFLDYYGGPANLTVADYLAASPPSPLSQHGASALYV